jgi:cyanophycinase
MVRDATEVDMLIKYSIYMSLSRLPSLFILIFGIASSATAVAQTAPAYQYFRVGNPANAISAHRAGYALMGGGTDLDEAFKFLCDRAGGGDLLVLRATGDDAYNAYIKNLCHLNSVATMVIPNRAAAGDPFVAKAIEHASALFIAGGNQANYIDFWQGTAVQTALNAAIARGVPLGGTSAGLAVLGEYSYTAQGDKPDDPNLDDKTALADPLGPRITLNKGFLAIPILKGVITDSHFAKRNRMGRLLVFLARLNEPDSKAAPQAASAIDGIGINERAAVLLDADGKAKVVGMGGAWFIRTGELKPLEHGQPLASGIFDVEKVTPGHNFDLGRWKGDGVAYRLTVKNGVMSSSQAGGEVY